MATKKAKDNRDGNRDPLSGEKGAHPVGTGLGAAAGGALAGAAAGVAGAAIEGAVAGTVVGGPVGTAVGAGIGIVAGAIGGGLAGKALAENIDPTEEDRHWRQNYKSQPYASEDASYDDYGPAYRYGCQSRIQCPESRTFEDAEGEMATGWEKARGTSKLSWGQAKSAARDAWDRVTTNARR